jgi:predicted DNA-binding protein (MmcQ/YjbR family)
VGRRADQRDGIAQQEHAGLSGPMIGAAELRDLCLGFPGSVETFPFGPQTSVFKVTGKMFALSQLAESPLRVSLKCEPPLAEQLRAAHPAVLPGYHLNKRHWNTVIIDGSIPEQVIRDLVEDSYDLVVSKLPLSGRRALSWDPDQE